MNKLKCLNEYHENLQFIKVCKSNLDELLETQKKQDNTVVDSELMEQLDLEINAEVDLINQITSSMNYALKLVHSVHNMELQLVLKKRFLENKSMYTIAAEMNCTRNTVYRKYRKVMKILGIELEVVQTNFDAPNNR